MFEVILFIISLILGIPFFIGYLVGKSDKKQPTLPRYIESDVRAADPQLRDRLLRFIASQPEKIKKADLLKEINATEPVKIVNQETQQATKVTPHHTVVSSKITEKKVAANEDQNINTMLYVASFLLVAAAVLFIGTNLPDAIKVVGAWGISIGFYIVGLFLHYASKRLRPAAVAFIGTGLALLPFAGLTMNVFIIHDATVSWFVTSFIGLFAFLYASLRLQSQLLSYLTMGFIFSLTTSSVAVLQAPLIWTFVLVIVVASMCHIAAYLYPKRLPSIFLKPINEGGQIAIPLTLLGSLLATDHLPLWQYTVIFTIAALHYAIAALQPVRQDSRRIYIFTARLLAMVAALIFSYDQSQNWEVFGLTLTCLASLQVLVSAIIVKKVKDSYNIAWLWIGMILQLLAILSWLNLTHQSYLIALTLSIVSITSVAVAWYLKRSRYATFGVLTIAALLPHVGLNVIQPPLAHYLFSLLFVVAATAMLIARAFWCTAGERLNVAASACVLYGFLALIFILGEPSGWQAIILCMLAILAAGASHVEKEPNFYTLTSLLFAVSVYILTDTFHINETLRFLVTGWVSGGIFYGIRTYFRVTSDIHRSSIMMNSSLAVLFFVGFIFAFDSTYTPQAASTLLVGAGLLWYEANIKKQHGLKEVALLIITFAMQRLVAYAPGSIDILVYTHWWAFVLALIAWLRYRIFNKQVALNWLVASLVIFSIPTGFAALDQPEKYQILFLLEHVGLLVLGGFLSYRLITIWGAVGVALSILYWLQGYTYLLVGIIGIGLLTFAVWRLLSRSTDS